MSRLSLLCVALLCLTLLICAPCVVSAPQTLYVAYEIENIYTIDLTAATFWVGTFDEQVDFVRSVSSHSRCIEWADTWPRLEIAFVFGPN